MKQDPATAVDRAALDTLPSSASFLSRFSSRLALRFTQHRSLLRRRRRFEELTLSHGVDQLKVQTYDAWPNLFRQSRFLSPWISSKPIASAAKSRKKWPASSPKWISYSFFPAREMLTISNHTGHPSLTLRAGFVEVPKALRLGARPKNLSQNFLPRSRAPRHHADRPPLRRRRPRSRRHRPRARLWRRQQRPPSF